MRRNGAKYRIYSALRRLGMPSVQAYKLMRAQFAVVFGR